MLSISVAFAIILSLSGAAPQDQEVLNTITHQFPNLGIEVIETRTLNAETGLVDRVAVGPGGRLVDINALQMQEQFLKIEARGKISPELRAKMNDLPDAGDLPVAFWLRTENAPDFRAIMRRAEQSGMSGEDARRLARDAGEQFFMPQNQAFSEMLVARGFEVTYTGTCWPIVIASVPVNTIEGLAARADVDQAYYSFPAWEGENNYAQPTLRTPTVHRRGNIGGDGAVKVMVQDSGGHVTQSNPYLPDVEWIVSGYSDDYHATGVAGNVCMQNHSTLYGGAYGLNKIYSAPGWGDDDAPAAWDAGMQAGVSFGNCSWWNFNKGSIVFLDRFFDYIVRNYGVLMFKSNGNQGNTSEPYGTSPGNGYNVLCTGCYNDGDTIKWDDDAMASYSSWWNPAEGHEKPEVASPGDDVDTTAISSPWIYYGFGGTSSASPLTMGVATLIANRAPSIVTHPEAVKALLMVTAWHNVEGAAVLSDKDGAGGIHAGAADAAARDDQFETGTFNTNSFPYEMTVPCYQGDRTRVICLWHSDPDSSYTTDVLKMDLDMTVIDPYGEVVAASSSDKNPFELVQFLPDFTGDYTVRLTKQKFLGTTEPYCIAWSTRQDAACCEIDITGTGAIGTTVEYDFYNPYQAGEAFVALLSLGSLPDVIPLGGGYVLPVAFDSVAYACLTGAIPGFYGTLDNGGEASASVTLPHNVNLIGLDLYCAWLTYDPIRMSPQDTSEAAFVIMN